VWERYLSASKQWAPKDISVWSLSRRAVCLVLVGLGTVRDLIASADVVTQHFLYLVILLALSLN
jgi:hypothetical protein